MTINDLNLIKAELYEGASRAVKALIVQSFTEVNVKTGNQFEAALFSTIPAGASTHLLLTTGSSPVIIKGFGIQSRNGDTERIVYRGATSTLGASVPTYSLNDILGTSPESTLNAVTNVNLEGATAVFAPRTKLAAEGSNQSPAQPSQPIEGIENVLRPSTQYTMEVTNLNEVAPVDVEFYITWYEGVIEEFRE